MPNPNGLKMVVLFASLRGAARPNNNSPMLHLMKSRRPVNCSAKCSEV